MSESPLGGIEKLGHLGDLRVAIVGVGNALNGDDAAGVLVTQALQSTRTEPITQQSRDGSAGKPDLLILDTGPAPEAFTGVLRRFAPELVILVDAAEMGEKPGTARVFDWQEAGGLSASTHSMPPSMLAKFLMLELGCRVALIGIQPARLDLDAPLSPEVRKAVEQVSAVLRQTIT